VTPASRKPADDDDESSSEESEEEDPAVTLTRETAEAVYETLAAIDPCRQTPTEISAANPREYVENSDCLLFVFDDNFS